MPAQQHEMRLIGNSQTRQPGHETTAPSAQLKWREECVR
jgi:hypothetical protein